MPTYRVLLSWSCSTLVDIEAEDEEQAENIAREMPCPEPEDCYDFDATIVEDDAVYLGGENRAAKPMNLPPEYHQQTLYWRVGYLDAANGRSLCSNPYSEPRQHEEWESGWTRFQEKH